MTAGPRAVRVSARAAGRGPRRALLPLALLAVVAAVHAAALAPGRAFYSRDVYGWWHPAVESFVRAVAEGAWPVWSPYFGFGEPLAANPAYQVFYPLTWLNLLVPPTLYFKLYVLVHSLGGGLGAAFLARRLRAGPAGALVSAATWAAAGPLLSAITMHHHFAGAAWMPWVVLALDRALRRPGARNAAALGAIAAGQALAGSGDMCFMTAVLAAGWTAASLARSPAARAATGRLAAALGVAVVLAALLGALQWLPALALVPGTARGGPSPEASMYWSLHPLSFLDLVVPRLTTGAAATTAMGAAARARLFEGREPLFASIYLGASAAAAAAWALATRRHRRTALLLAVGVAVCAAAAAGRHSPLLPALMHVPGVATFRFPPKYLLPAVLLWSLLVGLGVDAMRRGGGRRGPAVAFAGGLAALSAVVLALAITSGMPSDLARLLAEPLPAQPLLAHVRACLRTAAVVLAVSAVPFLALALRVQARVAAALLAVLAVGDLVRDGRSVDAPVPAELARYRPPAVEAVRAAVEGPPRILSFRHAKDRVSELYVRHPAGWTSGAGWVLGALDRLSPASGARWSLMGSYDGDLTGLAPAALGPLSIRMSDVSAGAAGVRLLQVAGVDAVLALDAGVFGGALPVVWQRESVFREPVRVLRTPDPLPKAFVARAAVAVPDEGEAQRLLEDPAHDARRVVIVPSLDGVAAGGQPAAAGPSEARVAWRRADALAVDVRGAAPGYLVVLEAFDRGWTVRVDGRPAPLLKANLLFRAVPVPAGEHRVEMRYRPRALYWGALASAAGAAAALALFRRGRLR